MTRVTAAARRVGARSGVSGFLLGASYVWRGFRMWSSRPRLMGWGLLPGVITLLVVAGVVIALSYNLGDAADWIVDRVAAGATGPLATILLVLVAIAILGGTLIAAFYTFTALTLFIGQPFFERISRQVDAELGAPERVAEEPWWRSTLRGLAEAVRLLALTVVVAIALFAVSFIPIVGSATAFVVGAVFGGWLLSLELTAFPLAQRGLITLRQRRATLSMQRSVATGFGTMVFLLFLLPLGAVVTMPAATVGATLLSRRLLGEGTTSASEPGGEPSPLAVTDARELPDG